MDSDILNLDPDTGFWLNLDPDPGPDPNPNPGLNYTVRFERKNYK